MILVVFLRKLRATSLLDNTLRVLIATLSIDAFRTLFENLYFGAYFNSVFGWLPAGIRDVLGQPTPLFLPKAVNIIAAVVILVILIRQWLPQATARQRAHHDTERRYHDVIASIDGIVWEADARQLRVTLISEGAERLLGYPLERWTNEPGFWRDHMHPEDLATVEDSLSSLAPGATLRELTYRMIDKAGETVWLQSTVSASSGNSTPILRGVSIDITGRKQQELRVAENERFIKTIADNLPALVTYWTRDLRCAFANRSVIDWFNADPARMIGIDMKTHLGEELFAEDYPHIARVLAGEPQQFARKLTKADGTKIETIAQFVPDIVDGEVRGYFALVSDITSIKEKETQLGLLEKAIARLNDIVMITETYAAQTERPRIVYVNDAIERLTGYSRDEVIGQSPRFLSGPETSTKELDRIKLTLAQGQDVHAELIAYRKDGSDFPLEIDITLLNDRAGHATHMVSILRDMTDRHLQERERLDAIRRLSESEAFANLVLQSVDAVITVSDQTGQLLRVNRKAEQASGYSEEELKDPAIFTRIVPLEEQEAVQEIRGLRDPRAFPIIHLNHWISRTGEKRLLRWANVALTDDRGNLTLLIAIGFDITDLQQHEKALIDAKNQAETANRAKSSFLATMSHELRTPLNAIIGFSDIMARQAFGPIENKKYAEYVNDICNSGKQLLSIINDILDLSRVEAGKQDLKIETITLADSWPQIASGLSAAAGRKNITLIPPDALDTIRFRADRRAVMQILTNLVSNAIKFTPAGGDIRLTSRRSYAEDEIILSVADTGRGIPPERLMDVMKPFVQIANSYHRDEGGVGLGLAICNGLAASMQGRIDIQSEPGQGTTVFVFLPLA
jgi:PAS domain S-box-containing protein